MVWGEKAELQNIRFDCDDVKQLPCEIVGGLKSGMNIKKPDDERPSTKNR